MVTVGLRHICFNTVFIKCMETNLDENQPKYDTVEDEDFWCGEIYQIFLIYGYLSNFRIPFVLFYSESCTYLKVAHI